MFNIEQIKIVTGADKYITEKGLQFIVMHDQNSIRTDESNSVKISRH